MSEFLQYGAVASARRTVTVRQALEDPAITGISANADLRGVWGLVKRVPTYTGPAFRARHAVSGLESEVFFNEDGYIRGTLPYGPNTRAIVLYDQTGNTDLTATNGGVAVIADDEICLNWRFRFDGTSQFISSNSQADSAAWKVAFPFWGLGMVRTTNSPSSDNRIFGTPAPTNWVEFGAWTYQDKMHWRINGSNGADWTGTDSASPGILNTHRAYIGALTSSGGRASIDGVTVGTLAAALPVAYNSNTTYRFSIGGDPLNVQQGCREDIVELVLFDYAHAGVLQEDIRRLSDIINTVNPARYAGYVPAFSSSVVNGTADSGLTGWTVSEITAVTQAALGGPSFATDRIGGPVTRAFQQQPLSIPADLIEAARAGNVRVKVDYDIYATAAATRYWHEVQVTPQGYGSAPYTDTPVTVPAEFTTKVSVVEHRTLYQQLPAGAESIMLRLETRAHVLALNTTDNVFVDNISAVFEVPPPELGIHKATYSVVFGGNPNGQAVHFAPIYAILGGSNNGLAVHRAPVYVIIEET